MINLTTTLFDKFCDKQKETDAMIKEKHNISDLQWTVSLQDQHEIALKVEMAEFINECRDVWKYWKTKEIDRERILDEAADVIHFIHLIYNKNPKRQNSAFVSQINGVQKDLYFDFVRDDTRRMTLESFWNMFLNFENIGKTYAILLSILGHYGFTLEDIEKAYDKKNQENHDRQQRGY